MRTFDLIVRDDDAVRMRDVLQEHGFRPSRGVQGGFDLRDERGRVVDVHTVRFDDGGNGYLEDDDRGPFEHPTAVFAAAGNIAGRRVACLSAEAQMTSHACGYTPHETDFRDMRLLNARLGTALLPPYIASRQNRLAGTPGAGGRAMDRRHGSDRPRRSADPHLLGRDPWVRVLAPDPKTYYIGIRPRKELPAKTAVT